MTNQTQTSDAFKVEPNESILLSDISPTTAWTQRDAQGEQVKFAAPIGQRSVERGNRAAICALYSPVCTGLIPPSAGAQREQVKFAARSANDRLREVTLPHFALFSDRFAQV
jgi:hypothetical protein